MLNPHYINIAELQTAYAQGALTVGNMVYQSAMKELYSIQNSFCEKDKETMNCLYLYLYALGTYCHDVDAINFMTDEQLQKILLRIEELKQVCCDYADTCSTPLPIEEDCTSSSTVIYGGIQKELIYFTDESSVEILLTTARLAKFGAALNIAVEALTEDGAYREIPFEVIPDAVPNTTKYTINFGAPTTGRIKIS